MPAHLAKVRSGLTQEEEEIRHAIEEAERDNARAGFTAESLTKRDQP